MEMGERGPPRFFNDPSCYKSATLYLPHLFLDLPPRDKVCAGHLRDRWPLPGGADLPEVDVVSVGSAGLIWKQGGRGSASAAGALAVRPGLDRVAPRKHVKGRGKLNGSKAGGQQAFLNGPSEQ